MYHEKYHKEDICAFFRTFTVHIGSGTQINTVTALWGHTSPSCSGSQLYSKRLDCSGINTELRHNADWQEGICIISRISDYIIYIWVYTFSNVWKPLYVFVQTSFPCSLLLFNLVSLFLPPIHVPVTVIPLVQPSSKTSDGEGEGSKKWEEKDEIRRGVGRVCEQRGSRGGRRTRWRGVREASEEEKEEGEQMFSPLSARKPLKVKLAWRISGQTECVSDCLHQLHQQRDDSSSFNLSYPLPSVPAGPSHLSQMSLRTQQSASQRFETVLERASSASLRATCITL